MASPDAEASAADDA